MRVLFLVAKLHTIEPFGVMSLVPALKSDGHVVGLMEAERPDLLACVGEFGPDIIGYSVCTGAQRFYLQLNRWLKQHLRFTSVFGGPHPTFFPEMIQEDGVDAICRGEGDLAMAEFCRGLQSAGQPGIVANFSVKVDGKVQSSRPRPLVQNLDELPWADRAIYYSVSPEIAAHRVRSFLAARGCPFACSYCFNPAMDKFYGGLWRDVRLRSPKSLVSEIAAVVGQFPTQFIAFRESIFPLKTDWLEEFTRLYATRIGLPFYCHLRLDLLHEANVRLLAQAGCFSVNVGLETGNETIRRELLNRRQSNTVLIEACKLLRRHRIRILANNMLGLPGTTFEDDMETLRLNQKCRVDYALAMMFQPYPGTELAQYAEAHGFHGGNYDLDFTYYGRSPLRFVRAGDKTRVENLQKLFAVAVALPWLSKPIALLTRLRPNRFFETVFRTMYLIFHQTEIFAHHLKWKDWARNLSHLTMEQ